MAVCYRHPGRETGVSCSSCGRPICPDCMTPTPVGMRCPECARDRTKVRTLRTLPAVPVVTQALIALNIVAFVAETAAGAPLGGVTGPTGGTVFDHAVLYGFAITHQHEYWRLLTAGFMHDGLLHILVNMVSLWFVGSALEPAIGRVNFLAIYLASLLAGSFGALLFAPDIRVVGASTAIFGIFGALLVLARARGISIWQSGLGMVLMLNLILSVTYTGISLGGHIGGFVGGLITGQLVVSVAERRGHKGLALLGCAVVAAISVAAAIAVAGGPGLAPHGVGFVGS